MSNKFQIASVSPGLIQPSIALATRRAGELAVLDFEYVRDQDAAAKAIQQFNHLAHASFGIKLRVESPDAFSTVVASLPDLANTVLLTSSRPRELQECVRVLREKQVTTLLEANCIEQFRIGLEIGVHGVIAKGHEAGGRIADETTFVLLQRFLAEIAAAGRDVKVWAHGGIGLHTAAACAAAGAAGVILDSQLALTRESPFGDWIKSRITAMDGSETICLGEQFGETYRMYSRPGNPAVKELQEIEARLIHDPRPQNEILAEWREAILERAGWECEQNAVMIGQDAAFAAPLAKRYRTVGGVLQALRGAIQSHCQAAGKLRPLLPDSPLAQSHRTRYPILQGPMTRVSDVPEFAARVAEDGALPFLALALMRGPEVKSLLAEARKRIGKMPWGVGILGFVPPELREEQMKVVLEYRPPFALIAGGRPDQARSLEQHGITSYLHVPSPGLLRMFVQQGARRFVFEGRECGGHVGPRTSFVLWNQMLDVLLDSPELQSSPQDFHIVFAAGIHDALSAAMVSVMAAPLAACGARLGVLLGTSYLFTEEAVAAGAILKTFQEQAQLCQQTVLLETGPGHSTRCVVTPFAQTFLQEKRRLSASGLGAEEIRMELETLNLGRLRIASKGVTRNTKFEQDKNTPKLVAIDESEQVAQGMYMIGQVAALRHSICTMASLHRSVSVESSNLLEGLADLNWQVPSTRPPQTSSDVAIVGLACLLPKAPDIQTYWENILQKVNAVGEIPPDRWDWKLYFDSDPKAKDKIYSKWGGFLSDVPFDPIEYGMPPASLRSIEPAQLLTLQVVRAALGDAGYADRPFPRERTSVILGAGGGAADLGLGYGARSFVPVLENLPEFQGRTKEILERLSERLPEWTEDSFAGILTNVSAGRVANRFNLGGSNYTVDAACASSLAAVSLALKELEGHTSDMVIVGGVDTMQNPFTYLCFSKTHALSPRGQCRTFDESADGIAISEGIAVMVLKRLEDAERDGDRIYAVIRGAGSSSDGKDRGLTAPRPEGQALALKRAYAKAGISPATVGLIEAHGTGTVAGDGAEVQALTNVFSEAKAPRQGCAIGSVKSMIGHTKCSAGAAGLLKTALALHHRVLPPTLGVEKPNPRARFPETPFFVNTEPRPWLENRDGSPRRAGVSAFGFGGTNFHVVMEEYTGETVSRSAPCREWPQELFLFRGDSRQALLENVEAWVKALDIEAQPALRDLAYTAWKQAEVKLARLQLAIISNSVDELKQKLAWAREGLAQRDAVVINDPRGVYFSEQPLGRQGKLAFLFPGQGSQYPRMLQDLLLHFPEMRKTVEQASRVLAKQIDKPLSDYIYPPPSFSREEENQQQRALTATNIAQPALGAIDSALFELLREFGLQPDMVAGHSYGEYVALAAAGVFSLETLIALSEARGRFIVEGAGAEPGVMAAIDADPPTVEGALKNFEGVCIANANAPRQTVISGPLTAVQQAVERFSAQGMTARLIPVACAFHSPLVAPAQARLAEFLSSVKVSEPVIPVYSNTTATPYPKEPQAVRQRLVDHLVRPVEFVREIEGMYNDGARVFVEVGPRNVLTGLLEQILGDRPKLTVASNQSGRSGVAQLLHLLGQLAAQGYSLKLDRLYRDRSDRRLDLKGLQRECAEKPLPASVWMVNGSRATPLGQASVRSSPQTQTNGIPVPNVPAAAANTHKGSPKSNGAPAVPFSSVAPLAGPSPVQTFPKATNMTAVPATAVPVHPMTTPPDGVPQVMSQFQHLMTRFLETQKTVMLAYLGGETGQARAGTSLAAPATQTAPLPATATPSNAPTVPQAPKPAVNGTAQVFPDAPFATPTAADTAAPVVEASPETKLSPSVPRKEELTERLLQIVTERTGYPSEMLDLNLDLEADLGIDSIKRVEILGTFQQAFSFTGEEGLMEKLTGVRTLQGIIDRVAEHLGPPARIPSAHAVAEAVPDKVRAADTQAVDKQQLTAQLLSIVSERTGYPPEMLDVNLDLEADLGIDSIKRVEILGTFQQSFASAGIDEEGLMEKLTGVRTLRGIIDHVFGQIGAKTVTAAVKQTPPAASSNGTSPNGVSINRASEPERIQRFTLTAVERPLSVKAGIAKDKTIVLVDGGHGVARALASELLGHGYKVAVIREGRNVQELDNGIYAADLGSLESVTTMIALVSQRQGPPGAIVHLPPPPGNGRFEAIEHDDWKEQLRLGVKSLFYLAKASGKYLRAAEGGTSLIAVTGMGGAFLCDLPDGGAAKFPDHGAMAGLIKTLALEWPEVRVKAVDLNLEENAETLARQLFDELGAADGLVEVGYSGGRRVTVKPIHAPLSLKGPAALELNSSSVILVTGGARGITALAAKRLAERYQPNLVLVGRSPLPQSEESTDTAGITGARELKASLMAQLRARGETVTAALVERAYARLTAEREIRSTLNTLRKLGAKVHYHSVDVRDREAFGKFVDGIYSSFGRLDGVIHGAGVIEDKLIEDKTVESFDRVFDTKVDSAFLLSRKLRPESLRFLIFFSSVSGRFGNRGQGDYAAANEVLNKLAVYLDRTWPCRVVAMNWGPWDTDGMVSAEVRKQFEERGVELITPATGLRRLEEEMNYGRRGEAEVVIGGAGWQSSPKGEASRHSWPLLQVVATHREANLESGSEFLRVFDPAHDLYLNDHRLDGQPVLPLAIATELIAEAVAQEWPEMQVAAVRDLRLLHGVVLENGSRSVRVVTKPQTGPSNSLNVAVEVTGVGKPHRIHYKATVELVQRLPEAPAFKVAPLTDARAFSLDVPDLYRRWLFHGPTFQGIKRVDLVGFSGIKASLGTSTPHGWVVGPASGGPASGGPASGQWLFDPLMFDSALQLLVLWAREHWEMTALPSGFQSFRRFAAPAPSRVVCELRLRSNTGAQTIHSDIYFLDAAGGNVLGIVEDMQGACSKTLNRLAGREVTAAAGSQL